MTWNESTQKVIYRSKRSWHTIQNFKIFTAVDFIAAVVEHIPPKGQQTVRYYGRYSNKSRGLDAKRGAPAPNWNLQSNSETSRTPGQHFSFYRHPKQKAAAPCVHSGETS